ncbi:MAG: hypothetical protein K5917_06770 [Clostridiales bacterium]|nr:hypothetical protein [Clostridiales bacterium]
MDYTKLFNDLRVVKKAETALKLIDIIKVIIMCFTTVFCVFETTAGIIKTKNENS